MITKIFKILAQVESIAKVYKVDPLDSALRSSLNLFPIGLAGNFSLTALLDNIEPFKTVINNPKVKVSLLLDKLII